MGFGTTDATQGTAARFDTSFWANAVFTVLARVTARETADSDEAAGYILAATFKRDGNVLAIVGAATVVHSAEDTGGWAATLDADGDDIRVRVTGAAATLVKWLSELEIQVNDEAPYTAS